MCLVAKSNKTGGSDGLVREIRYGGSSMIDSFQQLFEVVLREMLFPLQWREGLNS